VALGGAAIALALGVLVFRAVTRGPAPEGTPRPVPITALAFDPAVGLRVGDGMGRVGPLDGARDIAHTGPVRGLRLLPDGGWLTTASDSAARWSAEGRAMGRWRLSGRALNDALLLPDGDALVATDQGTVARVSEAGEIRWRVAGFHGRAAFGLAAAPDGQRMASVGSDQRLAIWRISDGEVLADWKAHNGWITAVHWAEDGLTTIGRDGQVLRWSPEGALLQRRVIDGGQLTALAVSPRWIAVGADDGFARVFPRAGEAPAIRFGAPEGAVMGLALSGDRLALGFESGRVQTWDVKTDPPAGME
jgi:WD40 repeat protein